MSVSLRDALVAIVLVLGIGGLVYAQKQSDFVAVDTATTTAGSISLEEVARHNVRTDCWAAINGGVYDLTSWIPQHPGGEEAILMLCGTDGSAAFNGQHGGATRQATILAGFKVGEFEAGSVSPANEVEDGPQGRGRGSDD